MNISFINPNLSGEFRLNIGLAALSTYIAKRTPHKIDILDVTFYRKNWQKYILRKIKKFRPQILGVSSLSYNFYDSLKIVRFIKEIIPDIFVIYGGVHPSLYPEKTLKFKDINAVVIGDGEYTLEKLLNALQNNQTLENINGITYKLDGKIYKNQKAEFIQDLDDLPFIDWSLFEIDKYEIINPYEINMLGSRGCPFNCSFCVNSILKNVCDGKYVRFRSPKNIISEMKYQIRQLKRPYLRYFYFWDDMFNLNDNFVKKFCDLLKDSKLDKIMTWSCSSRADHLSSEKVKMLSEANLNLTRLGIEAGNSYIRRKIYFKDFSTDKIITAMKLLKEYKIHTQTDFIIGGPKESKKEIMQTFKLIQIIKPSQLSVNTFQPWPLLEATKIFLEDGGRINEDDWKSVNSFFYKSTAEHNRIKRRDLNSLANKINLYYMKNTVLKYLRKEKFRFIYDILKFVLYLKWRYNFLFHDLFKLTIRKYIYEDNLNFKKIK